MDFRMLKRVVILLVFMLIVWVAVYGVSRINFGGDRQEPTCIDGIKNGDEEGIDCGVQACGAECPPEFKPLAAGDIIVFEIKEGDYDLIATVFNPNLDYGSSEVLYDLILKDSQKREVGRLAKKFYILPGQRKFIVENSVKESGQVSSAEVEIKSVQWEKLDPLGAVSFSLQSQELVVERSSTTRFSGVILNNSNFDFNQVDIVVRLIDGSGNTVAASRTDVRTLLSNTERHFVVTWPFPINVNSVRAVVQAETNLFLNDNYIRRYGSPGEKYQSYY